LIKTLGSLAVVLLGLTTAPVDGREAFEGRWAESPAECRDGDRPSSKTLIDMRDRTLGPLFDQYENHCRIRRVDRRGRGYSLRLTCFEFWDDFASARNSRQVTVDVELRGPDAARIDGRPFFRCRR